MKRSQRVGLVLLGSVPFVLVACDGEQVVTRDVSETVQYANEQACVVAGVPADACADAAETAREQHREIAPVYGDQAACALDFSLDSCIADPQRAQFNPLMAGFALTTLRAVTVAPGQSVPPEKQEEQSATSSSSSSGGGYGGSSGGSATSSHSNSWASRVWRWIGLGTDPYAPRYFSEPLYQERDRRGGYRLSSLDQQVKAGKTFAQARNARFRVASPAHFVTGFYDGSAPRAVSRGGFGSSHGSWGG
ncbi:DUF1190 domain-containing protein [Pseudomonas gingeri]|uniref:DUF1190 domain-containing protein n=1 Tax=Pseudomonas gingeri TaxID=117681 RepID=UPI0015A1270A|nr:DUF1190 domain-containing protein [Pseudomonas gingeri]NWE26349.1 DUF1190 domain-containing protein [Pseudomonas gingeri]NWE98497.1 DUF1190 domain-containing protein [Pseudomonas gingeri]